MVCTSILNKTRVISSPYMQRAACRSVGEKLKEKMGHKFIFGSHFSYKYGQLYRAMGGHTRSLYVVMWYVWIHMDLYFWNPDPD